MLSQRLARIRLTSCIPRRQLNPNSEASLLKDGVSGWFGREGGGTLIYGALPYFMTAFALPNDDATVNP